MTKVDVDLAQEAIYWRGLFLHRYAAIEFAIAELVTRGFLHAAYNHLGHPPFGPVKKLRRLRHLVTMDGPIANYRSELEPPLQEFEQFANHRNFMVHAIMVPRSKDSITFKMYDHREGVYSVGELFSS